MEKKATIVEVEMEEGEIVEVEMEEGDIVEEEVEEGEILEVVEVEIEEGVEVEEGEILEVEEGETVDVEVEDGEIVEEGEMEMGEMFRRLLEVNYFDEKIEMYLGGIREKFDKQMRMEGEYLLERLERGEYSVLLPMVGGYGSFLPTYTRHTNEFNSRQRQGWSRGILQVCKLALTATVSALKTEFSVLIMFGELKQQI